MVREIKQNSGLAPMHACVMCTSTHEGMGIGGQDWEKWVGIMLAFHVGASSLLLAASCGFLYWFCLAASLLVEQRAMGYGWGPAGFTCLSKATPRMETGSKTTTNSSSVK
jgi:hypothetical protein